MARNDGLDNPLSPNCRSTDWASVAKACQASDAVKSYNDSEAGLRILWCDGSDDTFSDPTAAINAIAEMEAC